MHHGAVAARENNIQTYLTLSHLPPPPPIDWQLNWDQYKTGHVAIMSRLTGGGWGCDTAKNDLFKQNTSLSDVPEKQN